MYPNSTLVMRQGEVDAWDNEEFQKAVIATGKKQIILAGITTDVCEYFSQYFKSFEFADANFHRHHFPRSIAPCRGIQRVGQR